MGKQKQESMTEVFVKNSIWNLLLAFLTKVGGFIFTLIIARYLLPEGFGTYSFILAIAIILMAFGDLGINQTLIILLSKNMKDEKKSRSYFSFLRRIKVRLLLIISLIFVFVLYFLSAYSLKYLGSIEISIFCAIYIFFFTLTSFFSSIYYVYLKVKYDFFKELIFQVIRFVGIISVVFFVGSSYKLTGIFLVLAFSSIIMFIYTYFYSKKLAPSLYCNNTLVAVDKKRIYKLLFYFSLGTLSLILFSEVDILMIGVLIKDLVYMGYYKAYFSLILGVSGVLGFSAILLPIFSSFSDFRLKGAFSKVSSYAVNLAMPACFGILVLGSYFVKVFYGDEYIPGVLILSVLSFLIISESLTGLFNAVISSRERPKFIAISLSLSIILNIILNFFLITLFLKISILYAVIGSAIATVISRYFFLACLWIYSKKNFGLSPSKKDIVKSFLSSIIMALVIFIISKNIELNYLWGPILVILGMAVYLISLWSVGGIKKEDKIILSILFKKIKLNIKKAQ